MTTYQIEDRQYKSQLAFIPVYKHFSPIEAGGSATETICGQYKNHISEMLQAGSILTLQSPSASADL